MNKIITTLVFSSFTILVIPNSALAADFLLTTDTSQCDSRTPPVTAIPGGSSLDVIQASRSEWENSGFNIGTLAAGEEIYSCILGQPSETGVNTPGKKAIDQATSSAVVAINSSIIQTSNIMTRLATLRAGNGFGFEYSNLNNNVKNNISSNLDSSRLGGGASADESGGLLDNRLSTFINGNYTTGNYDESSNSNGFDFDTGEITLGVDYRIIDQLFIGTAFGYTRSNTEMNQDLGQINANSYSLSIYSTYYSSASNFYIDALARIGWNDFQGNRRFTASVDGSTQEAQSSYKGNDYSFSLGTGYNFNIERLNIDPYARFDYTHYSINGYSESGDSNYSSDYFTVESQKIDSMRSAIGFEINYIFNTSFAVLSPLFRAEWQHEFMNDSRLLTSFRTETPGVGSRLSTGSPDRDFANLDFGLSAAFPHGVSAFFVYETLLANHLITSHSFNAGVRVNF